MSGFTRLAPVVVGTNFPNGVCDALISNWDGQVVTLIMETGGAQPGVPLAPGINSFRCTQVAAVSHPEAKLWAAYEVVPPP